MKIYEKIVRKLHNIYHDISDIMAKDTLHKISQDIDTLTALDITFGVEPLTRENLSDFYHKLYIPIIGDKNNAKIHNLLELMDEHEIVHNSRFFIFIRQGTTLLGWWICNHTKNTLRFGYKCNTKDTIKLKAWFGTLIDYLFFSFGIQHDVTAFTYWSDRNGYGWLWAATWLCIHKLLVGFKPYAPKNPTFLEINEHEITTPTIIFDGATQDRELTKVSLLHRNEIQNNYVHILTKKWFIITYL